jgi:hypothetical protein|tara:strand:+ start:1770 stop:1970 length:201 start_codon:yes stop_codon:yes gene_type:complete
MNNFHKNITLPMITFLKGLRDEYKQKGLVPTLDLLIEDLEDSDPEKQQEKSDEIRDGLREDGVKTN